MSAATDALLAKTDAELRFFVENPYFYQPEVVAAAHRELARRAASAPAAPTGGETLAAPPPAPAATGLATPRPSPTAPTAVPPAADFAADYLDEPAGRRPLLVPLLVGLAVLALGLGVYWWRTAAHNRATLAADNANKLSPAALKLETVASAPLPTVNADQEVARQLAIVPAAELRKASPQEMRQYRVVSRRFWQAERPTEFLISLAATGNAPSYALLVDQIRFTESQWHNSGNALVYGYHFPPTMADQVARMRAVASVERRVLEHIKNQALTNETLHLTDKDKAEYAIAQELLHGLTHQLRPVEMH